MKKTTKKINLMLAIILLLSSIFPTLFGISEVIAAEYKITWNGKVTYGPSTVRRFFSKWKASILY